jgi:iron complex outermembrane receptor protein
MQNFYKTTIVFFLILLATTGSLIAQSTTGKISGKVTTSDGQPAPGVTLTVKEIYRSAATNANGIFLISGIKAGTYTLVTSFIGTKAEQQSITVTAGQTTEAVFTLLESASELKEVTITHSKTINRKPVTIGKMNVAPMDLPQSIVTIGQDVIEQQQAIRLSEVIRNANGVYLYSARGGAQETFAARGYNFSSTNTFKNGFRSNSGAMPEMSSLEKVEILKGSAALLYGNVAPGGILNLVTKKPKFEQGGSVALTAGSYNLYKPVFDVYGPVSSKVAYRVNGTVEDANSYRNMVDQKRYYVNPSLLYKVSDRTNILVEADYLNHDFVPDFGTGQTSNSVFTGVPRNAYLGASWSTGRTQQASATATVNHQLNDVWQLSGGLSYQYYQRNSQSTERMTVNASGNWDRPLGKTRSWENYVTGQVNLNGQFNTGKVKHQVLIGSDVDRYNNTNYAYTGTVTLNPINAPTQTLTNQYINGDYQIQTITYDKSNIFNPNQPGLRNDVPVMNPISQSLTPTDRFGVYFNDLISLSEKVKVLAGIRWSYQDAKPVRNTAYLVSATSASNVAYNQDGVVSYGAGKVDKAFSPRVGVVYKPFTNTSLFASYSNSFVVNTGTDNNIVLSERQTLKPSLVDQYEAGIKNDFFNGGLSVNATVYRIRNNNLAQTAPFLSDGITLNTNTNVKMIAGTTQSDGVELDVAGHPMKGLDVVAGYSYNHARYIETPVSNGSFLPGQPLLNAPKHTANASTFYTLTTGKLKGLKAGISAFYLGKRWAGFNNNYSVNNAGVVTIVDNRLVPVKGFATVDASVGYSFRKVSVLGKISNIGNVLNYNVHENYSVNPIAPRQLIATATYRF